MIDKNIADLRLDYKKSFLLEADALSHPIDMFATWWQAVIDAKIEEPNAMVLGTVDEAQFPQTRVVLLKSFDANGFVFFTNYSSNKGKQISASPKVCLLFFWKELERQVRICGTIKKINVADSQAYFKSRPVGSQLGAVASKQSSVLANRAELDDAYNNLQQQYTEENIPMPEHWGGYVVEPVSIEFWQGRSSRLHDRLLYTQTTENNWQIDRLSP
jgi:pyridoxamine 5'-phosphate oxidase